MGIARRRAPGGTSCSAFHPPLRAYCTAVGGIDHHHLAGTHSFGRGKEGLHIVGRQRGHVGIGAERVGARVFDSLR